MQPNTTRYYGSIEDMREELNLLPWQGGGWYHGSFNWLLITETVDGWKVECWINRNPIAEIGKLLTLPIHRS